MVQSRKQVKSCRKDCTTCRWQPTDWEPDLSIRQRDIGDCRAPVPFWLKDAITSLAAPLQADPDDYRTMCRDAKGGITGLWAGDFPGCEAWEAMTSTGQP